MLFLDKSPKFAAACEIAAFVQNRDRQQKSRLLRFREFRLTLPLTILREEIYRFHSFNSHTRQSNFYHKRKYVQ